MQLLLNALYWAFDKFFGLIGSIAVPSWVSDLVVSVSQFIAITNFFFPIDTLVLVTLSVIGIVVILMVISALLQLL